MTRAFRELTDEDVLHQAAALRAYLLRGGSCSLWLGSKGFLPADRAAILVELADLDQADIV